MTRTSVATKVQLLKRGRTLPSGKKVATWTLRWAGPGGKRFTENIGKVGRMTKRQANEIRQRKEFSVDLDETFYEAVQSDLVARDQFVLTIARLDGEPVAGHVASMLGDTCVYLLGASNAEGRGTKASYLLQWKVIDEARQRGCNYYDLGGIDVEANPGVARFKQRMGGSVVSASGPYELSPRGLNRILTRSAEKLYRFVRGNRKRAKSAACEK